MKLLPHFPSNLIRGNKDGVGSRYRLVEIIICLFKNCSVLPIKMSRTANDITAKKKAGRILKKIQTRNKNCPGANSFHSVRKRKKKSFGLATLSKPRVSSGIFCVLLSWKPWRGSTDAVQNAVSLSICFLNTIADR